MDYYKLMDRKQRHIPDYIRRMKAKILAERNNIVMSPNKTDIGNKSTSIDSSKANSEMKKDPELEKIFSKTTKNVSKADT